MAVQPILSTDTLETGFRVKYNTSVNEIITSYQLLTNNLGAFTGVLRLIKFGGGFINIDLSGIYYTQAQIGALISAVNSSPYSGAWSNVAPYAVNSVVDHDGNLWRSVTAGNIDEPGTSAAWVSILDVAPSSVEIDFPAGGSTDLSIPYAAGVLTPGLFVYAEQYYLDNSIDPSGQNIFIPYAITYFKITSTNHILIRKSDPGDHIKITIKP